MTNAGFAYDREINYYLQSQSGPTRRKDPFKSMSKPCTRDTTKRPAASKPPVEVSYGRS